MNELKIKGHSGCSLNIIEGDNGILLVEKGCKESYIPRLKKQQEKQNDTYNKIKSGIYKNINVPESKWCDNKILMNYVNSKSFIEYFERAAITDIKQTISIIIDYIESELAQSENTEIKQDIFINKLSSILDTCIKNELVDNSKAEHYIQTAKEKILSYDSIVLPVGTCHGDLTFSNILFTDNGMHLIDFLDSFIETPLQDIVKVRQDTCYEWSTLMTTHEYNKVHIKMILEYIDNIIHEHFNKYDFYKYYNVLQYINILRILPYVKEDNVYDRVCKILNSIKL